MDANVLIAMTALGISGGLWALAVGAKTLLPGARPPDPPERRAPPGVPRTPGALSATPSIPAAYVGGSVFVAPGQVWSLLALIQQQLSPNCPGTAAEFSIEADSANQNPVFMGAASLLGGPLTASNFAYALRDTSAPRIYRSSYPGGNTPIGELQVFTASAGGGYLHIEVQS